MSRNPIARQLEKPQYRRRVVNNKKRDLDGSEEYDCDPGLIGTDKEPPGN